MERPAARGRRLFARFLRAVGRQGLRLIVAVVGFAVVIFGLVIGPIPGPGGTIVVFAGLTILATQFDWARRLLDWVKRRFREAFDKVRDRTGRRRGGDGTHGGEEADGILAP